MNKWFVFAAAALLGATVYGQDVKPIVKPGEGEASEVAKSGSKFSVEGEVNFTNAYYFRGFNNGDNGLIVQPEATFSYQVYKDDTLTVTPYATFWNNVTDKKYNGGDYWNEFDFTAGVNFEAKRLTFGVEYLLYNSPVNDFKTTHEVGFSLGFNDEEINRLPFALNPHVALYQEIDNPNKRAEGTYLEFGLAPESKVEKLPLTLTAPITLGTSLNHYYENTHGSNEFFGYASAGVVAKYDINDHWYIKGGVQYLQLLANNARIANGGDSHEVIGTIGVGFSY